MDANREQAPSGTARWANRPIKVHEVRDGRGKLVVNGPSKNKIAVDPGRARSRSLLGNLI